MKSVVQELEAQAHTQKFGFVKILGKEASTFISNINEIILCY